MNKVNRERGGIVVFTMIGIVLIGLLAGGLYLSKHQTQTAKEGTSPTVAIDTEKEATEKNTATTKGKDEKGAAPAPTTTSKPATSSTSTTVPSSGSSSAPATSSASGAVPSAGPSDTFAGIVVLGALTFAGILFVQSSSRLRRSALGR